MCDLPFYETATDGSRDGRDCSRSSLLPFLFPPEGFETRAAARHLQTSAASSAYRRAERISQLPPTGAANALVHWRDASMSTNEVEKLLQEANLAAVNLMLTGCHQS